MDIVTVAQVASALSSIAVYVIFAYLYWRLVKLQRYTIEETREQRISGGRPQVIVEADYRRLPEIDLVVRNVGGGPAKGISFDFSANIKGSSGFILTDLHYLRDGMDFLGPGGEIRCRWDDIDSLEDQLSDDGLERGIRIKASYQGMSGDAYHSDYVVNPLLYKGIENSRRRGIDDLVNLLEERMTPAASILSSESDGGREHDRSLANDPRHRL